jgi:hypothetical protein
VLTVPFLEPLPFGFYPGPSQALTSVPSFFAHLPAHLMPTMSRANQWFVPGDGIAREVITADIQRYLGPDALVRPGVGTGEYQVRSTSPTPRTNILTHTQGQGGYWITAYRTLTSVSVRSSHGAKAVD